MSVKFRLEPLPMEIFLPLLELSDEELQAQFSKWLIADAKPGYPCRVSLADAEVGERILATTFVHHDVQTPYRASGPLFVRETARIATPAVGEIPIMFNHRLLALRAYDAEGFMIAATVVPGTELEPAIVEHFAISEVEYQHIHTASLGCYDCAVRRA